MKYYVHIYNKMLYFKCKFRFHTNLCVYFDCCNHEKKLRSPVKDRVSIVLNFIFFILVTALKAAIRNIFDIIQSITFSN